MKKVFLIVGALALAGMSTSCKKDGATDSSKSEATVKGADDANDIIDFNNKIIEEYKKKSKRVDNILQYVDKALAKSKGENVPFIPSVMPMISFGKKEATEVPKAFGKDKDAMDKSYAGFKSSFETIEKKFDELKSYMSAEDYKDDKGAKADALAKEIEAASSTFFSSGDAIMKTMKPIADKAEEITLKDHPLKDYIISSKTILNNLDASYDAMDKSFAAGKYNEAEVQKAYDELEKSLKVNQAKKFEVKDTSYSSKGGYYDSFNKNISDYLDDLRKEMRDCKASGKVSESTMSSLDSSYDSAISSYNNFIN
ncbi:DUF3829 domain-containing protein [Soonwooa sp.]|uniref:DUF6845 domain-containing protein n=1 Tax=Soonwooa sp. TaxID=1938592 RepID=UPI0026262BE0|nr:DUF3829 domain-containing protein [Soonwooa sp.]